MSNWVTEALVPFIQLLVLIDFHNMKKKMAVNGNSCLVTNILQVMFNRRKKFTQVQNNLKVSKWWEKFHCGVKKFNQNWKCLVLNNIRPHWLSLYGQTRHFSNLLLCSTVLQVWNNVLVNKWYTNFHFFLNYCFESCKMVLSLGLSVSRT